MKFLCIGYFHCLSPQVSNRRARLSSDASVKYFLSTGETDGHLRLLRLALDKNYSTSYAFLQKKEEGLLEVTTLWLLVRDFDWGSFSFPLCLKIPFRIVFLSTRITCLVFVILYGIFCRQWLPTGDLALIYLFSIVSVFVIQPPSPLRSFSITPNTSEFLKI